MFVCRSFTALVVVVVALQYATPGLKLSLLPSKKNFGGNFNSCEIANTLSALGLIKPFHTERQFALSPLSFLLA